MTSEQIRQIILDQGWTEEQLELARQVLDHLAANPGDAAALHDYDRLREMLGPEESGIFADRPVSAAAWEAKAKEVVHAAGGPRASAFRVHTPVAWAAMLVLGACGWMLAWRQATVVPPPAAPPVGIRTATLRAPGAEQPNDKDINQTLDVFQQVKQVFTSHAAWVATTDSDAEVGLAPDVSAARSLLLLRLTVVHDGRALSSTNLALVVGQYAAWTVPLDAQRRLRYHVSTSCESPTQLSIWAEAEGAGQPQTLAALATRLPAYNPKNHDTGSFVFGSDDEQVQVAYIQAPTRTGGR